MRNCKQVLRNWATCSALHSHNIIHRPHIHTTVLSSGHNAIITHGSIPALAMPKGRPFAQTLSPPFFAFNFRDHIEEGSDHGGVWHTQISWRKLSQVALKPRKSWKFSPSKVFHYTVCGLYFKFLLRHVSLVPCPQALFWMVNSVLGGGGHRSHSYRPCPQSICMPARGNLCEFVRIGLLINLIMRFYCTFYCFITNRIILALFSGPFWYCCQFFNTFVTLTTSSGA